MIEPSKRSAVDPFIVMDVMQAAARVEARGRRVLHLEVGQPSTGAPLPVLEAARRALTDDRLGYTLALGLPALRERIAGHYERAYGLTLDPERIAVTAGASGAFVLACTALFDPGDRVAIARPGYPCYRNILRALDLVPVDVATGPESHFRLTPERLTALDPTVRGVILESPANPTGTLLDEGSMGALVRHAYARGIRVVSDEIYHGLVYGGRRAVTAAAFSEAPVVVNSFSKYFSMTGWRLGWMVVPPELVRRIELLAQNLVICPSALSQHAALAAFDAYDELEGHVARYAANRTVLLDALRAAGVTDIAPAEGAFYVYADVSAWTDDSRALVERLLEEIGVATTPGVDFDPVGGHRTLRLSYCAASDAVAEAAGRLSDWLSRHR